MCGGMAASVGGPIGTCERVWLMPFAQKLEEVGLKSARERTEEQLGHDLQAIYQTPCKCGPCGAMLCITGPVNLSDIRAL